MVSTALISRTVPVQFFTLTTHLAILCVICLVSWIRTLDVCVVMPVILFKFCLLNALIVNCPAVSFIILSILMPTLQRTNFPCAENRAVNDFLRKCEKLHDVAHDAFETEKRNLIEIQRVIFNTFFSTKSAIGDRSQLQLILATPNSFLRPGIRSKSSFSEEICFNSAFFHDEEKKITDAAGDRTHYLLVSGLKAMPYR